MHVVQQSIIIYWKCKNGVVNDLLVNVLRTQFEKVTYVSNITDIDDKIIDAAHELNEPIKNLTTKYTKIYNDDMII